MRVTSLAASAPQKLLLFGVAEGAAKFVDLTTGILASDVDPKVHEGPIRTVWMAFDGKISTAESESNSGFVRSQGNDK